MTKVFQIKNENKLKQGMKYIEDEEKTKQIVASYETELENKLQYIVDDHKTISNSELLIGTDGKKQLVSTYGLMSHQTAFTEMMWTKLHAKQFYGKTKNNKIDVLAHHIIQSFSPSDHITPEQAHEIGRRTILELTGGEYEFVIATHMDKEHLHNHIILNTTNNVTLKKFRWQKGTKKKLEHISDKHAAQFGAKIITEKRFGHNEYVSYISKNRFRTEIKRRIDFLKNYSVSFDDFIEKLNLLDVSVDLSGKEIKYRLLDRNQIRNVRALSLSKKGYYDKEKLEQFFNELTEEEKENIAQNTINDLKESYAEFVKYSDNEFELRFILESWQVQSEVKEGIYLSVDFGLGNSGTIFIDNKKFDKLDNGNYELFLKYSDYFYFMNERYADKNRYMKGYVLANQLTVNSGQPLIKKNKQISRMDNLIKEFNFLSKNNISDYKTYTEFVEKLRVEFDVAEKELDRLDSKIAQLNKIYSAMISDNSELSQEILSKLKLPTKINKHQLEKLIKDVRLERDILRSKFEEIIHKHDFSKTIERHTQQRQVNRKL